ncbi:hypothetical protein ACHAWC_011049 [Mediolabrus comicus]
MMLRQSHRSSKQCCFTINRIRGGGEKSCIKSSSTIFRPSSSNVVKSLTRFPHHVGGESRIHHFSSNTLAAKDYQPSLSKVPDYLIPPAYRKRNPDEDDKRERGRNSERNGTRSRSRRYSRSGGRQNRNNNSSNIHNNVRASRKSKHRRKSTGIFRHSPNRSRDSAAKNVDITDLKQLQTDLATKMNTYHDRLGEISFLNFGAYADKNDKEEDSYFFASSNNSGQNDDNLKAHYNDVTVADLHATEDLYKEIASDLHNLIIGFTAIAETACNAHLSQSRETDDGETESDSTEAMYTHYIDSVMKAERFLEAFETLHRNRIGAILKAKTNFERMKQAEEEKNVNTLGKISSFLGDVFLLKDSNKHSAFDESWKRADGKTELSDDDDHNNVHEQDELQVDTNYRSNNTLCVEQMIQTNQLAYCFGVDKKVESVQRSNRLLNRWISANYLSLNNVASGNTTETFMDENKDEDSSVVRKLFHTVMRQNVDLWTVEGVNQAEELLQQMHSLQKSGRIQCALDVDAYNIVLLGLCNLCRALSSKNPENDKPTRNTKRKDRSRRKFVLEGAERLLSQLNESHDMNINPNTLSLNLALNVLAKAGRDGDSELCKTANSLLLKTIGEENYRSVVGINEQSEVDEPTEDVLKNSEAVTKTYVEPNMDTYHWLVDIYSSTNDPAYVKLALSLLRKMIQHRLEEQSTASFAPSTGTYNNVLRALAKHGNLEDKLVSEDKLTEIRTEVAKEATSFLDSMIRYETSYPTRVTFIFLLQLWARTGSQEAGEYADQILSRMETVSLYQRDLKPFSNVYLLALECWHTATQAGYPNAAERAFRIVQIMEGKSGEDLISDDKEVTDDEIEGIFVSKRIYPMMIKICAAAQDKRDTPRSMAIAFDMLKKMEDNELKPGLNVFEMLYASVQNFLQQHPGEEANDLLQKVFVPASRHGVKPTELKCRTYLSEQRNRA